MENAKGKGRFIVLEGIDGAGKTTQAELLIERLVASGRKVKRTAEPTSLPSGKEIRRALSGEIKKSECEMALSFTLDRIIHNIHETEGINAALEQGYDVICDRYYYSNLAYQGQSTDYGWVKAMNLQCPEIRKPDACIYLDLTPEQSLKRISRGRSNVEIYENLEKLTEVRASFHSVIEDLRQNGEKIFIIDADRSREELAEEIYAVIKQL